MKRQICENKAINALLEMGRKKFYHKLKIYYSNKYDYIARYEYRCRLSVFIKV